MLSASHTLDLLFHKSHLPFPQPKESCMKPWLETNKPKE